MSYETCNRCRGVLLWAHETLVCASRACADAPQPQRGAGRVLPRIGSGNPAVDATPSAEKSGVIYR